MGDNADDTEYDDTEYDDTEYETYEVGDEETVPGLRPPHGHGRVPRRPAAQGRRDRP